MTSTPGLCVVGSFMYDLIAYTPRRPAAGETLAGTDFLQTPGGKGFNQAIAAARAGASVAMIGNLGDDQFGAEFESELDAAGIHRSGVSRDPEVGTGVGLPVVSEDGENAIIIVPRANHALTAAMVRQRADTIAAAEVLLLQLEVPMAANLEAARIAHEAGTTVVLNPAPYAELSAALLDLTDVATPNEGELAAWAGRDATGPEVAGIATELADRHGLDLIVTLGARGVLVARRGTAPVLVEPHRVDPVDTVGAGDVFCGQLCAAMIEGADLVDAARRANAAAAVAITRRGGALSAPTTSEVDALLTR